MCKNFSSLKIKLYLLLLIFLWYGKSFAEIDLTRYFSQEELQKRREFTILWLEIDESGLIRHYATHGYKSNWLEYKIVPHIYSENDKIISDPPYKCKEGRTCLVAISSYPYNCFLSNFDECASIIIPYSENALLERYKGQISFLTLGEQVRTKGTDTIGILSPTDKDDTTKQNTIEKADIYRISKNNIYFVNASINSIQIIDISNKGNPKLLTSYKFEQNKIPKELFLIDNFIYLISDYGFDSEIDILKHDGNNLLFIDKIKFSGNYYKSMRRNEYIYLITTKTNTNPLLHVFKKLSNGRLETINVESLDGTNILINLSYNFLIISSQTYVLNNINTKLGIYALTETEKGIRKIGDFILNGRVPSDRHIDIDDTKGLLRIVYYNPRNLSTNVGIYDLRKGLLTGQVDLIGEIRDLAKGESLHGAVFSDNRIYLVTYLMKDPLFVIDTYDPRNPKVLGQLIIPGWNEQLVFHNDLIFGLGYDDQAYGSSDFSWARRVSATLFDVSNPSNPLLLSRVTPFAGDPLIPTTTSDALNDERVFFVNWNTGLSAFPFHTYYYGSKKYIQALRIENKRLVDLGKLELPVNIRRVFTHKDSAEIIFSLGEQELNVLSVSDGSLKLLGSLELSRIYSWLGQNKYNGLILAGVKGTSGIYKLYTINRSLDQFNLFHNLATSFTNGINSDKYLLFYNPHNLEIQLISLVDNNITSLVKLDEKSSINLYIEPLIKDNKVYFLSQKAYINNKTRLNAIVYENYLHEYEIDMANSRLIHKNLYQIPGIPLGFNQDGDLITYESTNKLELRLNILSLKDKLVVLKNYKEFECNFYNKSIIVDKSEKANNVYLYCGKDTDYRDPIILKEENTNNLQKIIPPIIPNIGVLFVIDSKQLNEKTRITNIKDRMNLIKGFENYLVITKYNYDWYCPPGKICIMNEPSVKVILPQINEYWLVKIIKDNLIFLNKFDDNLNKYQLLFMEDRLYYVNDSNQIYVINISN